MRNITSDSLRIFDEWLLNNPDVTQEDRETIMEFVGDYLKKPLTFARIRSDLKNKYRLPIYGGGWIDLPKWTVCEQPDYLDNEEFNVILFNEIGKETHRVASIDLEFKEIK